MEKVITISREFGSGGRELGVKLAGALGIPFYDKELISMAADDINIAEEAFRYYDEHIEVRDPLDRQFYHAFSEIYQVPMSDQIFVAQSNVIRRLASHGPCVIVGRCADMVLADDNFATIVSAVEEGRRIYANMRKAIQFLLASNLAEVLSIFFATMIGFTILQPVHLLWINLITDCFPALALGLEESEPDSMKRKPRDPKEGIFAGGMGFDVFFQGVIVTALVLFSYVLGHRMESGVWEFVNSPDGTTMAFLTLSMVEICHSLNMRSRRGSIFKLNSHNKFLYGAMLASLILTTAVIEVPFLASAFQFTPIDLEEYAVALGLAILIIPIMEVVKAIQRKTGK